MAKDHLLLKSLLAEPMMNKEREKTQALMKEFFDIQTTRQPYTGLILIDDEKRVFDALSADVSAQALQMVGNNYGGIEFQGNNKSLHKVLVVYRASKDQPMGQKGLEMAFELKKNSRLLGWLVFQMNVDLLLSEYDIDENDLKKFHFEKS